ncbi:hypothetical protein [Streptosporangium sp. 'caverna']|uniref:hypothetical protein n=1 Tax=Streptosporangium sp. 'caverna' TaxID=2202249 RepID=UPI000D7E6B11|nr:hypothetical protein [Streptosporangium sp. 'caverna']AWS46972.1 hypothetical protein DKM19_42430 [Streptosporangium sp. 'caverna']
MSFTFHVPRARVALAAFACLAGLLAGCGTANEASSTASDSSTSTSGSASTSESAGTADQKYDAWEAKFRSCLSEAGFELPKGDGQIDFGDRQDAYKVAEDACLKKIGKPPTADDGPKLTPQEQQAVNLKRSQCLRDRGYDIKDPKPGGFFWPAFVSDADVQGCLNP